MNKVFLDIVFELLGKVLFSIVSAMVCTGVMCFCNHDIFWHGGFLGSCITVASILCAYEGIHQGVLVSTNTKFISAVCSGHYKKSFAILSMIPLVVSLTFVIYSLLIYVCTCTDSKSVVLMRDSWLAFFLWCFLFFAMISIFVHVHNLCLRIISESNFKI